MLQIRAHRRQLQGGAQSRRPPPSWPVWSLVFLVTGCARVLVPGYDLEKPVRDGQVHRYRFEVPASSFLRIEADSRHVDLMLSLAGPAGERVAEIEVPAWRWSPDVLAAVAEPAGTYQLEIRGCSSRDIEGEYTVRLEEVREAMAKDRAWVETHELYSQALAQTEKSHGCRDSEGTSYPEALENLERARDSWRELGDRSAEADALHSIGVVLSEDESEIRRYSEALERLTQALEIRQELDLPQPMAETLYRLGVPYERLGRFQESREVYKQALSMFKDLGQQEGEAYVENNLGWISDRTANHQAALDHLRNAMELFRDLGLRQDESIAMTNLGSEYRALGDYERAGEYFDDALRILDKLADLVEPDDLAELRDLRSRQASILNNVGWTYKAQGQLEEAVERFEAALAIAEELHAALAIAEEPHPGGQSIYLRRQSIYLDNLARAHLELGDPQSALGYASRAYQLSLDGEDRRALAVRLATLGLVNLALQDVAAARDRFEEALELSRNLGSRKNEIVALLGLARIEQRNGSPSQALDRVAQALGVVEAIRTDVVSENLRATYLASQRSLYELRVDLLVERARTRPGDASLEEAVEAAESARARSLLESLSATRREIRSGVDPALLAVERSLSDRLNAEEHERWKLSGRDNDTQELEASGLRLRDLDEELAAVEGRIRSSSPRFAALTQPQPLSVAEIRRQVLDEDSTLLEFFLGEERSYLFTVTLGSVAVYDLPPRDEIEDQALKVHELLAASDKWLQRPAAREHNAKFEEEARELSQTLLGAAAGTFEGKKRLLIVADWALQYIPFAALPVPGTGNPYEPLILEHEIVNLPSASVLAAQRREVAGRPPAPRALKIFADPVFEAGDTRLTRSGGPIREADSRRFRSLPETSREADAIFDLFPADACCRPRRGFQASREAVIGGELRHFDYVHFATHGVVDSKTPWRSALVFSLFDERGEPQDGFLRLHDIYNLELNAELVVLSACSTALGKHVQGEGLIGLSRGFLYAGARAVVASLWQVEDNPTSELMTDFYRAMLEEKKPPATALRQAQKRMRTTKGYPFYWAPFVLHGEWRQKRNGTLPIAPGGGIGAAPEPHR